MRPLSPQEVVGGFNRKESGARTWIYNTYEQIVLGMVEELTDNSQETNDLVSDVFTKLYEYRELFITVTEIRNFIHVTTVNICQNYLKHQRIRKEKSSEAGEYYLTILADDIERAEAYGYLGKFLWEQVEKMPPKTKEVIMLAYKEGLSNKEVASRLCISEKTVRNHKVDAKKILKIEVKKRGGRNAFYLLILLLNLLYEHL